MSDRFELYEAPAAEGWRDDLGVRRARRPLAPSPRGRQDRPTSTGMEPWLLAMEASETIDGTAVRDTIRTVTDGIAVPYGPIEDIDAPIRKPDHQAHKGRPP